MFHERRVYISRRKTEDSVQSTVQISSKIMFRPAILILTLIRLLLVEGTEPGNLVKNENRIAINPTKRIIYGTEANVQDFPYIVRLQLGGIYASCSGSIIANHWILTAAHCLRGLDCNTIKIFPVVWPHPQSIYAAQCYDHEQYVVGNYEYDIGLIRVDSDILQDGRTRPISLPLPGQSYPAGTPVLIAGWGATENTQFSYPLLKATVRLLSWDTCNLLYHEHHKHAVRDMPIRAMCVQGEGSTPSATCYRDSGGPAVTTDGFVIGVSSFVLNENKLCNYGAPAMYNNVVDYLRWIYSYVDPGRDTSGYPVRPEHILT